MKKAGSTPWRVFLLRVSASLFMIMGHGWPKFMKFVSGNPIQFADPLRIGSLLSFFLALFAEFFCALLILTGIMTRLCVIPIIISMSVAVFLFHSGDAFENKKLTLLYLAVYLTLFLTGPGALSLQTRLGIGSKGSGALIKFLLV